uniref:Uncharacterized protein n=1 Tax=Arundo donax TaxID=35708 RepID=A0A0A9E001_ARUDO
MFQPRRRVAPHKIFEAATFSSSVPHTAKEYNFSNSAILEAGVTISLSLSPIIGDPSTKDDQGFSWTGEEPSIGTM